MALLVSMLPVVSILKWLRSKKKKIYSLLKELAPWMERYIEGSVIPVYSGGNTCEIIEIILSFVK